MSLDRFADAILSGHDDASALKDRVAARVQHNTRIKKILEIYCVSLRKEKGMSWVFTILIDAILSGFRSDFTFLPLDNTPLKGARILRKPDAVFVPPQVARQFLELRDKFYATQAKEDADEMGYWKLLADCGSDRSSSRLCTTIAGAGAPKTADDESETAGTSANSRGWFWRL